LPSELGKNGVRSTWIGLSANCPTPTGRYTRPLRGTTPSKQMSERWHTICALKSTRSGIPSFHQSIRQLRRGLQAGVCRAGPRKLDQLGRAQRVPFERMNRWRTWFSSPMGVRTFALPSFQFSSNRRMRLRSRLTEMADRAQRFELPVIRPRKGRRTLVRLCSNLGLKHVSMAYGVRLGDMRDANRSIA